MTHQFFIVWILSKGLEHEPPKMIRLTNLISEYPTVDAPVHSVPLLIWQ